MKDGRLAPFCYQSLDACAAIRGRFTGSQRMQALAVYDSLTWAANEQRRREDIELSRTELAELAGVSTRTLDRVAGELESLGLLAREGGRKTGKPNTWTLFEPTQRCAPESHPSASPCVSESQGVSQPVSGGAQHSLTPSLTRARESRQEGKKEEPPLMGPPDEIGEEFRGWLSHHWATTQMVPPQEGTEDWRQVEFQYRARREEGIQAPHLELAIDGAWADDWKRDRGRVNYDHLSILKPSAPLRKLVEAGRNARRSGKKNDSGAWAGWVDEHFPELKGTARTQAIWSCQALAGGRAEVTVEAIRERVEQRARRAA